MRSARGRRRVWRAARRAAEQARDGDRVEESHCQAEEAKWEKWEKRQTDRQCTERTLHLVLHLPQNATATATTQATATATAGLLQQQQQQQNDEQDREGANLVQSSRQRDCAPSFVPWTGALLHNECSSQVQDLLFLVITPLSMGLEMAVALGAAVYAAIHSKPWLVEPVKESGCTFDSLVS